VKSLRDGTLEGVDAGGDDVSPCGVRTGSTDVERDEVLAVDADLLVDFEARFWEVLRSSRLLRFASYC